MVKIPYIKIPSVRVGSIVPTSNIGIGGATPAPPPPITYLTQWMIVGNSEVHGNEIWSCGEYNPTDGKYHILVQPQGGSIADIALTEPLRKVNDVADTIEFPSGTEGKALVTRSIRGEKLIEPRLSWSYINKQYRFYRQFFNNPTIIKPATADIIPQVLCALYEPITTNQSFLNSKNGINISHAYNVLFINDDTLNGSVDALLEKIANVSYYSVLVTPTTELVDAPQIEEADSYSMVISQGGKAVEWSSFDTD